MEKQIALTIEQMKYLEELGLDTNDASLMYLDDGEGELTLGFKNISFDEKEGDIPAYTLQDILMKLPYKIHYEYNGFSGDYRRVIGEYSIDYVEITMCPESEILVGFVYGSKEENSYNSGSMINAFYDMLVWCIENGYIKTNKNK